MTKLCITCGERPRKSGRRQCGHCAWRSEDTDKARVRRREYKRRLRRSQGVEPMEIKAQRAAKKRAEAEAKRAKRLAANSPERKPWLQFPEGSAERYRSRYQNDPAFAKRERERAIVFRFTHPELAVKSDKGNHWQLVAASADGSETKAVVRTLLRTKQCYICGVELTPDNRSIDHRIALTLGGEHTTNNLAACCLPCNRKKGVFERRLRQDSNLKRRRHYQVIDFRYFKNLGAEGAGDLGFHSVGEP